MQRPRLLILIDRVASGRVRHHVTFADVALRGKDVEDRTEAQAQKVWALRDMRWCVRSDPADQTPNRRAAGVTALLALIGERSTDAVMILFRAFPVARPELIDVPPPPLWWRTTPARRLAVRHDKAVPAFRTAGQPAPLRSPGGGTSKGADVERCVLLYEPRGLLGQSVGLLVIRQPTVRRHPLEVLHVAGGFQPLLHAPESGAQRRHLSRRSPCSNSSDALESSQVTGKPSQCDIPTTASSAASSAVSSAHACSSTNGPLGPCMHPRPRRFGATGMHVNVTSHKVLRQIHAGT